MTQQQIEEIKREVERILGDLFEAGKRYGEDLYYAKDDALYLMKRNAIDDAKSRIESKLREVEEEKTDRPSWRCGKCEQEEMMKKGIAIVDPIPEHSIRCSLRKSNKLEGKDDTTTD